MEEVILVLAYRETLLQAGNELFKFECTLIRFILIYINEM
jgi:hypothetical protein